MLFIVILTNVFVTQECVANLMESVVGLKKVISEKDVRN
jgi:hypothetical protein